MGKTPETLLTDKIREAILAEYPDAYIQKQHGNPYQTGGLPDLLVIIEGRAYGIEVKAQRQGESYEHALGRVTVRQKSRMAKMRKAGATAGPALSVGMALTLIRDARLGFIAGA